MRYFPIFLDLDGQQVLVVGGGAVAERKIRLLLQAGARVRVVAEALNENVRRWADGGSVSWVGSEYSRERISGMRLVFAATGDGELNRRVYDDAEAAGVPVNVVDDQALCRFISPAVVDRSPVQIAISTAGTAPVLARRIRSWIETLLPRRLGRVAAAAGSLRAEVKRKLPAGARRKFWEVLLNDANLHRWSTSDSSRILAELQAGLARERPAPGAGRVYLVGAGPGNPDLLTLRALNVLGQADVVLHDRLASGEVLELARRDADRIYVGKRSGSHHRSQEEINRLMVSEARRGRTVVRLKGGDAFIFGRGGEELEALRDAGVSYEVVPGITAATGCAAYTGIPLTHRAHAGAVTFLTGHRVAGAGGDVEWSAIAGAGKTAVVYMGLGNAAGIRQGLLDAGIGPGLPVALISSGTRDDQKTLHGTVDGLAGLARQLDRGHPVLLIIGQVAALGSNLAWFAESTAARAAA